MTVLKKQPQRKASIQSRLIIAFAIILSLLLIVASIAIVRFSLLTNNLHELVHVQTQNARQAQQLYHYSQASALDLLRILHSNQRDKRVPLYESMDMAISMADLSLNALRKNVAPELVSPISNLRKEYRKTFYSTVEMLELQSLEAAQTHFESKTEPVLKQLLTQTMAFDAQQQADMQNKTSALQRQINQARTLIIIISIAALFIGLVLAIKIARGISKPVNQAAQLAASIADGDYSPSLPQSNFPELHTLFNALGQMRDNILAREQHITRLAYTDTLTSLANRTRFLECLEVAVDKEAGVLVIFNINRFTNINNALGHYIADEILKHVGERLLEACGQSSCAARIDSDRFAVLLTHSENLRDTENTINKLLDRVSQPIEIRGQRLDIDARAGLVRFPEDGISIAHLMQMADNALSQAKARYLRFTFADPCKENEGVEQLSLLGEMHEALQKDQFTLFYQPKIQASTEQIKGVEALIRWEHPEKGMIRPDLFIPFSEQTGFIRNLTPWVIKQALKDSQQWLKSGQELTVSVNISTLDLTNTEFPNMVKTELQASGIAPEYLCLEVTESALMIEPAQALQHLHDLASLGVRLSIDDYGTGQASLSYVKDLPVHELKIDRVFVSNVNQQPKKAAIVGATIIMCDKLGLEVVAEGVETIEEINWLQHQDCHLLQGFGVAKPMPPKQLQEWMTQRRPT